MEITGDISRLSDGDKQALEKLLQAAKLFDKIYTRQMWSGNEALRQKLEADTATELAPAASTAGAVASVMPAAAVRIRSGPACSRSLRTPSTPIGCL